MSLFSQKVFREIFFGRSDVDTRSQALHHQREWLEQAAERKRRQDSLIDLARELDLEKTARLPKFDRFCNGTRQSGFTLIELMVVVGIIAILAAIAVPQYLSYSTRSKLSEGMILAQSAETAIADGYQQAGVQGVIDAANAFNTSGVGGATPMSKYVSAISVSSSNDANLGQIVIAFNDANTGLSAGKDQLYIFPVISANVTPASATDLFDAVTAGNGTGTLDWACVSASGNYATKALGFTTANLGTVPAAYAPASCQ